MSTLLQNPIALLLITGTLIGFNFPLGKVAGDVGISPLMWAMALSLGASMLLLPVLIAKRRLMLPKGRMVRYVIISALISFIIPNILLFSVIPHAGAGYTGLMFALSPVFTLSLAAVFKMQTPNRLGLIGIAIGFMGAIVVSISRGTGVEAPPLMWIGAAMLIPAALACGNIYRTLDWPKDAAPDALAFWSHGFALIVFVVLMLGTQNTVPMHELGLAPWASLSQVVIGGLTFPVFFRLQRIGGPVLLSQIGYVAAAVGLMVATVLLGEHYSPMTWIGAAIIAMGIVLTVMAQRKAVKPQPCADDRQKSLLKIQTATPLRRV